MPAFSRMRDTTKPHLSGAATRLMAERHDRRKRRAARREALVEATSATLFLVAAIALPSAAGVAAPPALVTIAVILSVAVVSRVEFDVGAGLTYPLQLVFVPALFVLDP